MIKISVRLENYFTTEYKMIEITKEELEQYACNKARGMYGGDYYTHISPDGYIELK